VTLQRGHLLDNGRYSIVRILGRGGYGFVYLGGDTRLREPVAIKELIPALVDDPATVKRFVQEARATMRLTHPNLVHTHDVFQDGDNWYTVMDYLPAGSLSDRLGSSPLPMDEALQIMADLCAGLAYAHAHGVVHCDIKPANVLFDEQGRVRLADFGIAHIPAEFSSRSWRTDTGFVAGTLCYMSPEQTDGVRDDPRVDIYALGVLLYEMLAGRRYLDFDTRNTPSAQAKNIDAIKTQMPEPLADVPGELSAVVMRALAKDPEKRYTDAKVFSTELSYLMPGSMYVPAPPTGIESKAAPSPATPAPAPVSRLPPKTLVAWLAAMTGLVMVALIVSVLLFGRDGHKPTPTPTYIALPVQEGTPMPQPAVAISPENVDQVVQLAQWGKGTVEEVAFSPDGTLLAVASSLGVHVYNAETLEEVFLIESDAWLTSVAFSPDGQTLASGALDDTVRLWRVSDGALLHILEAEGVNSVAFSPDGQTLASGSWDETVRLWQVSDEALLHILEGHTEGVRSVTFSPDGQTLASGSWDDTVRLWRVSDGALLHTLEGHTGDVESVAFSPDGQTLASGADDTVRLWRVSDGALLHTLEGYARDVRSVAFSPDGRILALGSYANAKLWQVSDGALLRTLEDYTDYVTSMAFSPDGHTLALGARDDPVRLWRVSDGALLHTLKGHIDNVTSVAFSPDGQILASGSWDKTVRLWQVSDGMLLRTLEGHTWYVTSVAFSPDGQLLATGAEDDTARLWQISDGKLLHTLEGHAGWVLSVAFSPDGQLLATGAADATVRLWRVSDGALLHTLEGHAGCVASVAFSPDGQTLASGSWDDTVRLWQVSDGESLRISEGHTDDVTSVAFSPDGQILASGARDDTVRLWRVSDGELLRTLEGNAEDVESTVFGPDARDVESVAFSPDGQTLASGAKDTTVRLWRVSDGELLRTLKGHTGAVWSVAFSPKGAMLASGAWDAIVRLWGILRDSGQEEAPQLATPSTSSPSPMPTPDPDDTVARPTRTPRPRRLPPTVTSTPKSDLQFTGAIIWDPLVASCSGPAISRQSIVQDAYGNSVDGVRIQVECYGNTWLSHPSGSPGEYETGHYDFSFGQSTPQDWSCTARVFDVNGQPVDSSEMVTIRFDTSDCNSGGSGHQVVIVNWIMHWSSTHISTPTPMPIPTEMPTPTETPWEPIAGDTWIRPADGMVMVYIPAGEFLMGDDRSGAKHTVYLDAYWIDRTEVTNAQYQKCVEAGACSAPRWRGGDKDQFNAPNQPVVCMSWQEAADFASWAGGRLPTEAEWEKAARGTDGRLYPWGNSAPDCSKANFGMCELEHTVAVGSYPAGASPYGVLDMAGNVWEWVSDWYDQGYYSRSSTQNPQGPDTGTYRGLRGGSYRTGDGNLRCATRYGYDPSYWPKEYGFRVVISAP
jgi:WD40 repeat protein/formylglycine-generating enzyme required for sulfatase activity